MIKNKLYNKVSSYEAKVNEVKKVLLLYSGGLDTSIILKWICEKYNAEIITLTMDIGQQHDDMKAIQKKSLKLGAKEAIIMDVKEEFANDYLSKGIKANASYQGDYHLSTPIGRALIAKKAVEVAEQEKVDAIAHGCTGKGNDQVRLEAYMLTLDPKIKIIAPVREWNMDRNEEIEYAKKHNIKVPATIDIPYSVDDNMWGMTWEGGEIENPEIVPPIDKFLTTYTLARKAPDNEKIVEIAFKKGLPVSLNGKKLKLSSLIKKLNKLAGKHGVGIVYMLEDRLVGVKDRGVYELPAAHVIIKAHKALEQYVCTRELNELKQQLDIKWAYLCYGAKWYDPVMGALNAFNDNVNQKVNGKVKLKLYKGKVEVVAMKSEYGLNYASFNNSEGYEFNVNASPGFVEIYGLQMKLANQIGSNNNDTK